VLPTRFVSKQCSCVLFLKRAKNVNPLLPDRKIKVVHKWDARPRKVTIGSVLSVAIVCPVKARPRRMTTAMFSQ